MMQQIFSVLAACGDYDTYFDMWKAFAFRDAIACPFADSVGALFTGLVIVGSVNTALYAKQESVILPLVTTLLTGGATLTMVSSIANGLVIVVLLLAFGIGPVLLIRRGEGL